MSESKASSLLASLTGDDVGAAGNNSMNKNDSKPTTNGISDESNFDKEQDLFGDIPIDDEPATSLPDAASSFLTAATSTPLTESSVPPVADQNAQAPAPAELNSQVPPVASPSVGKSSLLASSGLLGDVTEGMNGTTGGGGGSSGGLFDEVDELQRRQEEEEKARIQKEEDEKKRQQEELARQQQLQQEQQQQEQQQQQQQQQQIQLQQQQMMMAGVGNEVQPLTGSMQNMTLGQQQQQQQQQPQNFHHQQQQQLQYQQQQYLPQQQQQPPQQPQLQSQQHDPSAGFYRDHRTAQQPQMMTHQQQQQHQQQQHQQQPINSNNTYYYSTRGGPVQTHNIVAPQSEGRYAHTPGIVPPQQQQQQHQHPSVLAGLHNGPAQFNKKPIYVKPVIPTKPMFGKITVSDPMLAQGGSGGLFGLVPSAPHWTYQVRTDLLPENTNGQGGYWIVRRRFKHVVALEERLHASCPGSILPPRPEKHATRAIEEASSQQSAQFALHRASELQYYFNSLVKHPIAGHSDVLKLFLSLQDDVGTAWPEVSSNALTRIGNMTSNAKSAVTDTTASFSNADSKMPFHQHNDAGEDNAEIIGLSSSENLRMGSVLQAVPKLEGAMALIREHGEWSGAVGIEFNKLSKDLLERFSDRELSVPLEIMSNGLLRNARRTKRLALELSAALQTYVMQYKLVRYEKIAFQDRKTALIKRQKERSKADAVAQRLVIMQRSLQSTNNMYQQDRMESEASAADQMATTAVHECDEIGERLTYEVNRIASIRRNEWSKSMKVIASSMKEACTERVAIWESTKEAFNQAFPDYEITTIAAPLQQQQPQPQMLAATSLNNSNVASGSVPLNGSTVAPPAAPTPQEVPIAGGANTLTG